MLQLFSYHLSSSFTAKIFTCLFLVLIGDIFFYEHIPGWTLGLFAALLLGGLICHNIRLFSSWQGKLFALLALGQAAYFIILPSWLGVIIYSFCIISLALNLPQSGAHTGAWCYHVIRYCFLGWGRAISDYSHVRRIWKKRRKAILTTPNRMAILLPLITAIVFITLFANANPLIARFMDNIDWSFFSQPPSLLRVILWVLIAFPCWALIRARLHITHPSATGSSTAPKVLDRFFTNGSLFGSLILFNTLFFIQNFLDVLFIWSTDTLPSGLTYAEYAHQGAYPLLATVILAAAYVLIALHPKVDTAGRIKVLVMVWIGQNIFLSFSCMARLYGYVGEYSLTYMRLAAFIWVMLVICGLLLIIFRISLGKSNTWLINNNAIILAGVLYLCSIVPLGTLTANFNVNHLDNEKELDVHYLTSLGSQALPALRLYARQLPEGYRLRNTRDAIESLEESLRTDQREWQSWTGYGYYLLATTQD